MLRQIRNHDNDNTAGATSLLNSLCLGGQSRHPARSDPSRAEARFRDLRSWLTVLTVVLILGQAEQLFAQPGRGPSPVVVSRVVATRQAGSITFVGSLVPSRRSIVGSAVDGRVTEMFVDHGDAVNDGDPLVHLRTVSLDIEIEAAQVELRMRQQAENELQKSLPTEIAAAESVIEEIKARLEFSKGTFERMKNLDETGGGVSRQEVDQALATYQSQRQLNVGAAILLKKLTVTRESRLSQARFKVEAQEAEIRRLRELKDKYTIRAPFSGYISVKHTELGQWVSRGEAVLEVIQLDPIELVVPVPQAYIQTLHKALDDSRSTNSSLRATVSVDSLSHSFTGDVVQIVPQADLRSRSFPVRIRIDNPATATDHGTLKAGMLARATWFIGDHEEDILLVKKDALVLGGRQTSLYIVSQDPQTQASVARLVPVELGAAIEDWIEVVGDIKSGDQVVVLGNERLRPGQSIAVSKELPDTLPEIPDSPSNSMER